MKIIANKEKLQAARANQGLTAAEVSRRVGISAMGYHNIEHNIHGADPATAKSISQVLGKNIGELFEIRS